MKNSNIAYVELMLNESMSIADEEFPEPFILDEDELDLLAERIDNIDNPLPGFWH